MEKPRRSARSYLALASRRVATVLPSTARLSVALVLLGFALTWRWPSLVELRPWLLVAVPIAAGLLLTVEVRVLRERHAAVARALAAATAFAAALALCLALASEARFRITKARVLSAEPARLARLGRHLVVGYHDAAEAEALLRRRAIGGVFVTARNVAGRTAAEVAAELARFQHLRASTGEAPLWIAADQEGGRVSRLSPPLPPAPPPRTVAERCRPGPGGCTEVEAYAAAQAAGLAGLGVNLDLAPVVDLDHGLPVPRDRYTRIDQRAIGSDPQQVARAADAYCTALARERVACTLKHFPGLGRVVDDTHRTPATLATPAAELAQSDWVPYQAARTGPRFTMLAHARLEAVDPTRPASTSRAVVDLLRRDLQLSGPLVTDDFSMMAIFRSEQGVGGGAVDALTAGVDLVLVTYDPDQYFVAMDALLRADRDGRLRPEVLRDSEERLDVARRLLVP